MNNPTTSPRRLHPLIAVAAGTVIVASLAATAAITGVFPKASSSSVQNDQSQTAQVASQPVVDSAAPAAAPNQQQVAQNAPPSPTQAQAAPRAPGQVPYSGQPGQPSYAQQPPGQSVPAGQQLAQQPYAQSQQPSGQSAYCASCGTVESIVTVRREGHGTGIGAVGGAVAGGLLGNQFGRGTGRTAMTVLGAVGGGFAGNSVEKHLRSETDYQVRVRMENGHLRYFTYRQAPPFQQGERVHIERGTLVAG
ncbi:glycine zipper 2TM domain-containing protein [Trinickia sp. NRRL B-1857]|uniref:glycine zipper 2TM domain-containing protein n=1 Tax=Trinickia sp. NRRL B-1857 TaxID=3162879 RepID=UPI003D2E69A0